MSEFFREKKRFHLFKSLLFKNGKEQNMPLVAGRLVQLTIKCQISVFVCVVA